MCRTGEASRMWLQIRISSAKKFCRRFMNERWGLENNRTGLKCANSNERHFRLLRSASSELWFTTKTSNELAAIHRLLPKHFSPDSCSRGSNKKNKKIMLAGLCVGIGVKCCSASVPICYRVPFSFVCTKHECEEFYNVAALLTRLSKAKASGALSIMSVAKWYRCKSIGIFFKIPQFPDKYKRFLLA